MPATRTLGSYIGPAFRRLRLEAPMSQAAVCKALNKSPDYRSFISKIETGTGDNGANLSIDTLAALSKAIGAPPSRIVAAAEEMLGRDATVVTHLCPPKGSKVMPCCHRSSHDPEVLDDRMTIRAAAVTCPGALDSNLISKEE